MDKGALSLYKKTSERGNSETYYDHTNKIPVE